MSWGLITYRAVRPIPPFHAISTSPPGGSGLVGQQYPNQYDDFVPVAVEGHYHVHRDYDLLNAAIQAIQLALGLNPAGDCGTITSRLFSRRGNLAAKADGAGWTRIQYGVTTAQAGEFNYANPTFELDLSAFDWGDEIDNGFGAGNPLVFLAPARETDPFGAVWYEDGPWRFGLVNQGGFQFGNYKAIAQQRDGFDIATSDTTEVYIQFLAINWDLP